MIEIEYKYKVDPKAALEYLDRVRAGSICNEELVKTESIEQYYIVDDGNVALRVRVSKDEHDVRTNTLTVKSANPGISRLEIEREILNEEADGLLQLTDRCVSKTRYSISTPSGIWEFDVFNDNLDGLVYAEFEVSHEDQQYALPACDGMVLVDGIEHSNAYLSSFAVGV